MTTVPLPGSTTSAPPPPSTTTSEPSGDQERSPGTGPIDMLPTCRPSTAEYVMTKDDSPVLFAIAGKVINLLLGIQAGLQLSTQAMSLLVAVTFMVAPIATTRRTMSLVMPMVT